MAKVNEARWAVEAVGEYLQEQIQRLQAENARLREALCGVWNALGQKRYTEPGRRGFYCRLCKLKNGRHEPECPFAVLTDTADWLDKAALAIVHNANQHRDKNPALPMLLEEIAEYVYARDGNHEHPPDYELIQIGGIAINLLRKEWGGNG